MLRTWHITALHGPEGSVAICDQALMTAVGVHGARKDGGGRGLLPRLSGAPVHQHLWRSAGDITIGTLSRNLHTVFTATCVERGICMATNQAVYAAQAVERLVGRVDELAACVQRATFDIFDKANGAEWRNVKAAFDARNELVGGVTKELINTSFRCDWGHVNCLNPSWSIKSKASMHICLCILRAQTLTM